MAGSELPLVVIVAHAADEHADAIEARLSARECVILRTSREALPSESLTWTPNGLRIGGKEVRPAGGLWRRPGSPSATEFAVEYSTFVERECEDAFDGSMLASRISWLSEPHAIRDAELKIRQLQVATELHISFPPTIVTNAADDARSFAANHGPVVVKPVRYGLVSNGSTPLVAWTSEASEEDLGSLDGAPVIIQAKVHAHAHLRVVTVERDVFVSRLSTPHLDWRSDLANHHRFASVSPDAFGTVREGALRLAEMLRVGYSSQDWIVGPDGQETFLDLNPSGQWLFVDGPHEGAITSAIAEALFNRALAVQ